MQIKASLLAIQRTMERTTEVVAMSPSSTMSAVSLDSFCIVERKRAEKGKWVSEQGEIDAIAVGIHISQHS